MWWTPSLELRVEGRLDQTLCYSEVRMAGAGRQPPPVIPGKVISLFFSAVRQTWAQTWASRGKLVSGESLTLSALPFPQL